MSNKDFFEVCKRFVSNYYKETINEDDIYVVWCCKILQNNKALLSTKIEDGMYFEITYNGDKEEFYFDAYKKQSNFVFMEVK